MYIVAFSTRGPVEMNGGEHEVKSVNTKLPLTPSTSLVFTLIPFSSASPGSSDGKASAYNVGDPGSILGLGRSPGEGNGNPLQYSCLENPMDGEA